MGQRQRGQKKSRVSDASMNDEFSFDALLWIDPSSDSRLIALQENLISLEARAYEALEHFLPQPIARRLKRNQK